MNEPVRSVYEQFCNGGWSYLQGLAKDREEETLHLDFKRKKDTQNGKPDRIDKSNFSKALSGFANAEGGVLAWGVDARQGADGFDAVQGLAPITEVDKFASLLKGMAPQLTSPPFQGSNSTRSRTPRARRKVW